MKKTLVISVAVVALAATFPSCKSWSTWSRQEKGLAIGGVSGAGLGALIGAASGSWAWGAVIGAAGGALAGYFIADATEPEVRPAGAGMANSKRAEADDYLRRANQANSPADSEYFLKKSIDAYPTASAYNNLGLIHLQRGNRIEAERMWRKALDLEPGHQPSRKNLDKILAS